MRTFTQRSDKFVLPVIIMILFASTIWISSISALPKQQTSVGVKITDPAKGLCQVHPATTPLLPAGFL